MILAVVSWLALAIVVALAGFGIIGLPVLLGAVVVALLLQAALLHRFFTITARMRAAMVAISSAAESIVVDDDPAFAEAQAEAEEDHSDDDIVRLVARVNKRWRQRIEGMEQRLTRSRYVLARLPDPVLLLDERRRVIEANDAARELLGQALLGRDLAVALRTPAVLTAVNAVLKDGRDRIIDFELSTSVERQLRARVIALPGMRGVLLALHDQTAAKRSEQMRGDFIANASHELRTPLSTLLGFIETLRGPAADDAEAQRRFLDIMHQQATRMIRLVEDLLSLSRIELNEHMAPTDQVDIDTLLADMVDALHLKAAARGIEIQTEIAEDCSLVIGDADELAQVLQNLLDNAIKYGKPHSPVRVVVAPSPKLQPGIAIAVHDRGEGIPRAHLPRLTERFYRVDSARSRQMGGTGLGLAIVKHIVSRHRGQLDIDSKVGEGSVFTVHLPTVSQPTSIAPTVLRAMTSTAPIP
ncbi:MAG TPA: ATP-binding protein [Stellaceae bacterium]|nr:ATP-binding protein [Stellaceae bacterium]